MKYHVEIKRSVFEDENGNINREYRQECIKEIGEFLRTGKIGEIEKIGLFSDMDDIRITPLQVTPKRKYSYRPRFSSCRYGSRRRA